MVKGTDMVVLELLFLFSSIAAIVDAQPGFISIDCGIIEGSNYTDEKTGIFYTSDVGYTNGGVNVDISSHLNSSTIDRQYITMRSFPNGNKNCYKLQPLVNGGKYLVRASFMHSSFSDGEVLPEFELYLGVNPWTPVMAANMSRRPWWTEIIMITSKDYLDICLLRKMGFGDPFISSLELRPLEMEMYENATSLGQAILLQQRVDAGSQTGRIIRFKDDKFDRIWEPGSSEGWKILSTSLPVTNFLHISLPPSSVMRTAVTPANNDSVIYFNWTTENPDIPSYVVWHFAEVEVLENGRVREFSVCFGDVLCYRGIDLAYLDAYIIHQLTFSNHSSLESPASSTLPPLYNAVELYKLLILSQLPTSEQDVEAMMDIRRMYDVERDWVGDPCLPQDYRWEGVNCSYEDSSSPRIISIDLSASRLHDALIPSFSKLTALKHLDLSRNNLTGEFPAFFAEMSSISYLNLSGNNMIGSIPSALQDKSRNKSLVLSVDGNPNLCKFQSCKDKGRSFFPLVAVVLPTVIVVILVLFALWWKLRKRELIDNFLDEWQDTRLLKLDNQQFTYSEILHITKNFEKVIGKGGFGIVYSGCMRDGRQVAVKILSQNFRGSSEFRTEVELLLRIHHRNLVCLIGYCIEDNNMALVLEYMAQGNLGKALSEDTTVFLSWTQRLRIALDIAQGLEYLHIGCKPPIIHRDVKATNILLNKNLDAKIADFGLSKVFSNDDNTHATTGVKGTIGYLDPECFISNTVNEKTDVYSYGVLLLELATGRPPIVQTKDSERMGIVQWVGSLALEDEISEIVDARLEGDFDCDSARKVVDLAMQCTLPKPVQRPTMSKVVEELKGCLGSGWGEPMMSKGFNPSNSLDSLFFPSAR